MLIAALGFSLMQGLIKFVTHIHVFQIVFFRSLITAVISTITLRKLNVPLIGNNQKILFLRSIVGLISMTLFFLTIQRIPYGASVTLRYLSPFFTFLLAVWLLKEKVKPIQWLFLLAALAGVVLLKGFDARIDNLSMLLAVLGSFFAGCVYILIRKIGKTEHPLVIVNYFMSTATVISGIAMIFFLANAYSKGFFDINYIRSIWICRSKVHDPFIPKRRSKYCSSI
jgi:drug/metabolite transporter (DMT)-like permease